MQQTASETLSTPPVVTEVPGRALVSWVLFEWAAQPFYTLVQTFLFGPYFATAVVGDPKQGQALWGYAAAAAGVLVAIGSPLLGAVADAGDGGSVRHTGTKCGTCAAARCPSRT